VFHCTVRESAAAQWTVRVNDGSCHVDRGHVGRPDCRIEMSENTFLGLEAGQLDPQAAFLTGQIKVSDLALLIRFVRAFRG
jgi:putative sterol carrier protein